MKVAVHNIGAARNGQAITIPISLDSHDGEILPSMGLQFNVSAVAGAKPCTFTVNLAELREAIKHLDIPLDETDMRRPVEGSIWQRNDELFIVERVYDAREAVPASEGTALPSRPVVMVKHRCIDPMPNHSRLGDFLKHYEPYDPADESDEH